MDMQNYTRIDKNVTCSAESNHNSTIAIAPFVFLATASVFLFSMFSIFFPNTVGQLGQADAAFLGMAFGSLEVPFLILLFLASIFFFRAGRGRSLRKGLGLVLAYCSLSLLCQAAGFDTGSFGEFLCLCATPYLGVCGTALLSLALLLSSLMLFNSSVCLAKRLSLIASFLFAFFCMRVPFNRAAKYTPIKNFEYSQHLPVERSGLGPLSHPIEEALSEFGFSAKLVEESRGPVVTQFFLSLGRGTKSSQIKAIEHDIAREIAADSARVNQVVPGKPYISVEVPNLQRDTVYSSDLFKDAPKEKFPLVLGVNAMGERALLSLEDLPHLLIGGATGSGKTVLLQNLILSLLSFSTAKIALIDPKRLDLNIFNGASALAAPIAFDSEHAEMLLQNLVFEMEERYIAMQEQGAKTCEEINAPRIAVFVDELADIIDFGSIEPSLIRLSAKARACGIHLILCTQRPCAKTFSAKLKANINTRIALATSSYDSRIILGEGGAEHLVSNGDMLLLKGGKISRLHGGFLDDDFLSARIEKTIPQYLPIFGKTNVVSFPSAEEDLYKKSLALLENNNELSISKIQRQLKVGYNKAASIEERLIKNGLLGDPIGGNRGRAVLA